jgi:hypothetical protein
MTLLASSKNRRFRVFSMEASGIKAFAIHRLRHSIALVGRGIVGYEQLAIETANRGPARLHRLPEIVALVVGGNNQARSHRITTGHNRRSLGIGRIFVDDYRQLESAQNAITDFRGASDYVPVAESNSADWRGIILLCPRLK